MTLDRTTAPERIGIVGGGAMGAGIAQVAALAGHPVTLFDVKAGAAEAACETIRAGLRKLVSRGTLTEARAHEAAGSLHAASALRALGDSAVLIEAVREDLGVKRALFMELARMVAPDAVLSTNTSSLSITEIAAGIHRPDRVCGFHFFNPAQIMPLVEVVAGAETGAAVTGRMADLARRWGKTPVVVRSSPGFIVNRVARPFYLEPLRVLEQDGGDPATIDAVMRDSGGFPMGPFELMDLIGHDVNFAVTEAVHRGFNGAARFRPSRLQQALVSSGRLGRKTGEGFYDYSPGSVRPSARFAPSGPKPNRVRVSGATGPLAGVVGMLRAAGAEVVASDSASDVPVRIDVDGISVVATDGRRATVMAAAEGVEDLVVCDLALDFASAKSVGVAAADQASPNALSAAAALFESLGKTAIVLRDTPGLIVMRTVAMIVNEAAEAVRAGVASAADVDTAMTLGVNHPTGPSGWRDRVGHATIVRVLEALGESDGGEGYRVSQHLRAPSEVLHG